MANYLIEFRVQGYAKKYARKLIYEISKKFRVSGMTRNGAVPHISLYGPFTTTNEKEMVSLVQRVCQKYDRIYFSFKGFNYFDNPANKVIYMDIRPSEDLKKFRHDLSKTLMSQTSTISREDRRDINDFMFHTTIAFKDIDRKFKDVWTYVSNKQKQDIRQTLLRVTIIKNGKILCEYDFLQKRLLNRRQALNKQIFRRTIQLLSQQSRQQAIEPQNVDDAPKKQGIWGKIKSFFKVR